MVKADHLESTHVRTVVAHVADRRGAFDLLLEDSVVRGLIDLDIRHLATVEAFASNLLGTSFQGLTFSMRAHPDSTNPLTEELSPVRPGPSVDGVVADVAAVLAPAAFARFDAPRRGTSVFDGTNNEEFLLQLPDLDPARHRAGERISFRAGAASVARLATELERPLSFVHAPVSAPTHHSVPRGITGPCLRVGVAFARYDDRLRLRFGTELVDICCREGYGLWQRGAVAGMADHDFWRPLVPLPEGNGRRDVPTYTVGPGGPDAPVTDRPVDHALAVTCVGTAMPGATDALLQVLAQAGAPLGALAETTLDDMGIIHLMTRTPLTPAAVAALRPGRRADVAVGEALGLAHPPTSDRLAHYRALVSSRAEVAPDPHLAAIWLAWTTPATPDALRHTVRALRSALDAISARYGAGDDPIDDDHLNIEYLVGREVSDDWLRGRMKVAVDLGALGGLRPDAGETVSPARLGQFCRDVERQWRALLSNALRTANVDLEVVWRESWIGRWASMHVDPRDQRDER
jgi:hypothetical protein